MGTVAAKDQLLKESEQGKALHRANKTGRNGKKNLYLESYGCQMNFSDSEIVASIMEQQDFATTRDMHQADVIFINTCAIRENAEQRVRKRLEIFNSIKEKNPGLLVGVLGCMAERLKKKLLEEEKIVDLVVGPDAYRDLPRLVDEAEGGQKAVNVFLSREETYADISPVRLNSNGVSAFISIMRGCNNMCSFCVVPFTRGRERSRDPYSIAGEAKNLFNKGFREVTLLGQNVDSYHWKKEETGEIVRFSGLLELVAQIHPKLRVRFSTSHPKDITEDVITTMAKYDNLCNHIHFPAQSGNSRILKLMNRTYDRNWYLDRIKMIRNIIPDIGLSSDIIAGFCTETEQEHQDTLTLMDEIKFDMSYMFCYSERPGTLAAKRYEDDIPTDIKKRRLQEIIGRQQKHSLENNQKDIGKTFEVLIEGTSKKSEKMLRGRNSQNKMIVFPAGNHKSGDYVNVKVNDCTSATLMGEIT